MHSNSFPKPLPNQSRRSYSFIQSIPFLTKNNMTIHPPSLVANDSVVASFFAFALISTFFRLWYRWRIRRLWWDDFWVLLAMSGYFFVALVCLIFPVNLLKYKSDGIQFFRCLGVLIGSIFTHWCARMSLEVAVVRLAPQGLFRRIAKAVAFLFASILLGLILHVIFIYGIQLTNVEITYCKSTTLTAYLELSTDIFGDLWLIFGSAYMCSTMNLSTRHRRLVQLIFATSIFVILAGIAHIYFNVSNQPGYVSITSHIGLGISILVCNLVVLGTWFYRVMEETLQHPSTEISDETKDARFPDGDHAPGRDLMARLPTYPRTAFTLTNVETNHEREYGSRLFSTFDNPPSWIRSPEHNPVLSNQQSARMSIP